MTKRIAITSFEASGDLHSALLVKKIKEIDKDVVFWGAGGHHIKSAGVDYFTDTSLWGVIGIWEALKKVPDLYFKVEKMKAEILNFNPDLLVMIDSPAINVRIAKFEKKHNIKTMYYFPPSAWRRENLKKTKFYADLVDYIVPVFDHTVKAYKKVEKKVYYFGHPISDAVLPEKKDGEEIRRKYNIKEKNVIGLLPGSRPQEIRFLLKDMIMSAELIYKKEKDVCFLIPAANLNIKKIIQSSLEKIKPEIPVKFASSAYEVMQTSKFIMTSSGTATLEAAYFLTPMIVLYRLGFFDAMAARILFPYLKLISLPNVIAGKEIVPEFLQEKINPEKIAQTGLKMLNDNRYIEDIVNNLRIIKDNFKTGGVVDKVAKLVLEIIRKQKTDDRNPRTGNRKQKTDDGRQETEN